MTHRAARGPVPPGSTIGILGAGQLGRMLGVAAVQLGYRVHVYAPRPGPACDCSADYVAGDYDDLARLEAFARGVDIVTFEFENVPAEAVAALSAIVTVAPGAKALEIAQDRAKEKAFARSCAMRTAPFAVIETDADVGLASDTITGPAILKTSRLGYDGKGQIRLSDTSELLNAWDKLGRVPCVLEGLVAFDYEFSLLMVRSRSEGTRWWDAPVNTHVGGILATSQLPAPADIDAHLGQAIADSALFGDELDYEGVLAIEYFATADGPVFNEFAPRVHNSGHWTIEGAATSQFENHVRAICGLPLGSTAMTGSSVVMENLIGDISARTTDLLADPGCNLHLYGKTEWRPGRKMGHATWVDKPRANGEEAA